MIQILNVDYELHPKQAEAFETEATEVLFGGATRGGKSHFLRVSLIVWCLAIPKLQCTLIRKKYQDILDNHVYGHNGFIDLLKPLIDAKQVRVTQEAVSFANGARIVFKHCQDERQFETAQGIPSNVLAIDEATQISERLIKTFRAWCTMPEEMKATLPPEWKGKFPRIWYFANPIGTSVGYFRRKFVKARPWGAIEEVEGFKRQFILARVQDNPSEDPIATKGRIEGMHDAATAKALLDANWDAPTGDFFPEWDEDRHVVPNFTPPAHWFRYRTFDWGSKDPFAVYWFAVSDGDQFDANVQEVEDGILVARRRTLWFPRGARIIYREWYGCRDDDPAKGIGMRNSDIALGILDRSPGAEEQGIVTLADSFPFPDLGQEGGQTIAKTFLDYGCPLTLGDTSRVTGWAAMRDALIGEQFDLNSQERIPMLFVQEQCRFAREYIPALPRHKNEAKKLNDATEDGEATHSCDAIRLGCLATPRIYEKQAATIEQIQKKAASVTPKLTFNDALTMVQQHKERESGTRY